MTQANGKVKTVGGDITVQDALDILEKDRRYFYRSGGGLTLSGGESLVQYEFARDLLHAAKDAGFSTVHLDVNILRCETASLYGMAVLQTTILENKKWQLKE